MGVACNQLLIVKVPERGEGGGRGKWRGGGKWRSEEWRADDWIRLLLLNPQSDALSYSPLLLISECKRQAPIPVYGLRLWFYGYGAGRGGPLRQGGR